METKETNLKSGNHFNIRFEVSEYFIKSRYGSLEKYKNYIQSDERVKRFYISQADNVKCYIVAIYQRVDLNS